MEGRDRIKSEEEGGGGRERGERERERGERERVREGGRVP